MAGYLEPDRRLSLPGRQSKRGSCEYQHIDQSGEFALLHFPIKHPAIPRPYQPSRRFKRFLPLSSQHRGQCISLCCVLSDATWTNTHHSLESRWLPHRDSSCWFVKRDYSHVYSNRRKFSEPYVAGYLGEPALGERRLLQYDKCLRPRAGNT